jgi:hypothetical protein
LEKPGNFRGKSQEIQENSGKSKIVKEIFWKRKKPNS